MKRRVQNSQRMKTTRLHHGARLAWLRILRGWTQQVLAERAGLKQQEVSEIESKEELANEVILRYLKTLGVEWDMFNEMDESAVSDMSFNSYDHGVSGLGFSFTNTNHFHPLEELIKQLEELKASYKEQIEFLKELLKSKDADIAALKQQLAKLEAKLEKLEARIAELEEEIKTLQAKLNNTK